MANLRHDLSKFKFLKSFALESRIEVAPFLHRSCLRIFLGYTEEEHREKTDKQKSQAGKTPLFSLLDRLLLLRQL
jgi:hypothetical protein